MENSSVFKEMMRFGRGGLIGRAEELLKKPDYSTKSKRKRLVEERFQKVRKIYRKIWGEDVWISEDKRKKAVLNNFDRAVREFNHLNLQSIEESFLKFETETILNYEMLEKGDHFMLAAALWILDDLRWNNRLQDAYRFLPDSVEDIDNAWIAMDYYHPCYETELIESVLHTIHVQNIRGQGRAAFEGLMGLLDEERVRTAVDKFKTAQWQAIGAFLKIEEYFDEQYEKVLQSIRDLNPASVMVAIPDDAEKRMKDILKHGLDLDDRRLEFNLQFEHLFGAGEDRVAGSRKFARMMDITIDDPYELCFAAVYLLGMDDEAAWMMKSAVSVVNAADRLLPWYYFEEEWDDDVDEPVQLIYNRNDWLSGDRSADYPDVYHRDKPDGRNLAQRIYALSHGIIPAGMHPHEADRQEMKDDGFEYADYVADWSEYLFLSKFRARADNLHRNAGRQIPDLEELRKRTDYLFRTIMGDEDLSAEQKDMEIDPDIVKAEPAAEEMLHLRKQLEESRKQIKKLYGTMHEERQQSEMKLERMEKELNILRMEHRELADLRELVFNREQEISEKPEKQIRYPYEVSKRTVVFGGHDTFLKSIKPMLPNVRFVDVGIIGFNPEIIRNADVVWVQNNCISHSQYWSVVKHCKLAGVQLRYFAYASAEKCAEQLVTEDEK